MKTPQERAKREAEAERFYRDTLGKARYPTSMRLTHEQRVMLSEIAAVFGYTQTEAAGKAIEFMAHHLKLAPDGDIQENVRRARALLFDRIAVLSVAPPPAELPEDDDSLTLQSRTKV